MNVTPSMLLASERTAPAPACAELARAEQDVADAAWWGVCLLVAVVAAQLCIVDWGHARVRARRAWRRWRRAS